MIKRILFAFAIFTIIYYPLSFTLGLILKIIYRLLPKSIYILKIIEKYGQVVIKIIATLVTARFAKMVHKGE